MKRVMVVTAIVSMVVLAGLAYGDMGGHGMGHGMMAGEGTGCGMMGGHGGCGCMADGDHMGKHLMGLNLDDQQKTAIAGIKSRMMKDSIRRKADMRIAGLELKDLVAADPVDMKAVETKLRQVEAMRTEMHMAHIRTMEEVKAKLTPEQKKKFRAMIEDGPVMGGMHMGHDQECPMSKK